MLSMTDLLCIFQSLICLAVCRFFTDYGGRAADARFAGLLSSDCANALYIACMASVLLPEGGCRRDRQALLLAMQDFLLKTLAIGTPLP